MVDQKLYCGGKKKEQAIENQDMLGDILLENKEHLTYASTPRFNILRPIAAQDTRRLKQQLSTKNNQC